MNIAGWDIDPALNPGLVNKLHAQLGLQQMSATNADARAALLGMFRCAYGLAKPDNLSMAEHLLVGGATFISPDPFVNQSFYFGAEKENRISRARGVYDHHRNHIQSLSTVRGMENERNRLESMVAPEGERILTRSLRCVIIAGQVERELTMYGAKIKINCDTGECSIRPYPGGQQYPC
jgi:hypothetical protein